ncbi:uncharacterized protein LOC132728287 [Ruditapes philippinarum]|uniref:uncharacterized protein LOC132728287 n=1 Tax=Ruditapes philippinarum TaxID=129788 RepID=UPI00295B0CC6|nr:uncharacterized protein LOC132728287 [Ruditapes philippinarum]
MWIGVQWVLFWLFLQCRPSTCDVHIYVSPQGSDHNDGHSDKLPVQTIYKAFSIAGQARYKGNSVFIELMHGYYDLPRTLVIARHNTTIRSYNHQEVHVTGGKRIPSTFVKPVSDSSILSRLTATARTHVREVNLHDLGISDFGKMEPYGLNVHRNSPLEVFYNGQPLQLAKWPNQGYIDISDVPDGKNGLKYRFNSSSDIPQSWLKESDPWAYGFWFTGWGDNAIKINSIDPATKTVTLTQKAPQGLRKGHLQQFRDGVSNIEGGYFHFINILGALDEPGEYYMDRDSGKLYFWLPNKDGNVKETDIIYIPMINDCIGIRGHTQDVQLLDFTLEACRRNGIVAPNAKRVQLSNLEIRNTGAGAVSLTGDSRDSEISKCYIHDTCGGIWMYGGNRHKLDASGNTINNNEIARFSRVGALGNYAITLVGVGHQVTNNHIYDGQHGAIQFLGNDMVMEHNLIHHVCMNMSSCGAIRTGYDWTFQGNKIAYNIIHHTIRHVPGGMCEAVLLDGQTSGTSVMYNSFYDNTLHVFIGGGRNNNVENNVMYNAEIGSIDVDERGVHHYADADLLRKLHAMPYKDSAWSQRYPNLLNIEIKNYSLPEGNQISRNVIYARPHTKHILGITTLMKTDLSRFFNITQTVFSSGGHDHYNVESGDLRVRCLALQQASQINFTQPPLPNSVGPLFSPVGPYYLNRIRWHLVNTTQTSYPCTTQAPPINPPKPAYLPDGSRKNDLYPVENTGCWLNVTKCRHHPAAIGTYRDMYGERYRNAGDNETMCFRRAYEQWQFCGSHRDEKVAAIYGPTGATTLRGEGCMTATYGCPKHGGPVDNHPNSTLGKYQNDYIGDQTHTEHGCLKRAFNIWHYCGSSSQYPVTNVYLKTGAKLTAGGGCWITLKSCPAHTDTKSIFYDAFGSTNFQTDDSEFACLSQAEYYWNYCGSDVRYPVTANYRPTITSKTYP